MNLLTHKNYKRIIKMSFKLVLFATLIAFLNAKDIAVSTSTELKNALAAALPGDVITMADGIYTGQFKATTSGTSTSRITLKGTKNAKLTSQSVGYGLQVTGSYWTFTGFTVYQASKGIVLDSANFCILDRLTVTQINEEGVHFRTNSCDNTIKNSTISYTGRGEGKAGVGEGVYIGSDMGKWVNGVKDLSHRNKVIYNTFGPHITAEAIDIKEGTEDGLIQGNVFDGTGMSGENFGNF